MLLSVLLGLYFWTVLVSTAFFLAPYAVLRGLGQESVSYRYATVVARTWARHLLWVARVGVSVDGLENYPRKAPRVCVVSNHQGYADILLLEAYLPAIGGFVAKEELRQIPILSTWMRVFRCVFINRKNVRRGVAAINRAIAHIKNGYPMLIFPEGTRSLSRRMGRFRSGALKLAIDSQATIVPVTLDGTYRILEEKGRLRRVHTRMILHPPLDFAEYRGTPRSDLSGRLGAIIGRAL